MASTHNRCSGRAYDRTFCDALVICPVCGDTHRESDVSYREGREHDLVVCGLSGEWAPEADAGEPMMPRCEADGYVTGQVCP